MGYTPDLVVGAWMAHTGNDAKGNPIGRYPLHGLFGVTTAAFMFKDFLPVYYGSRAIPTFQRPAGISGDGTICRTTPKSTRPRRRPRQALPQRPRSRRCTPVTAAPSSCGSGGGDLKIQGT